MKSLLIPYLPKIMNGKTLYCDDTIVEQNMMHKLDLLNK